MILPISHPTNTPLQPGQLFEPFARLQQHPCAGSPGGKDPVFAKFPSISGWKSPEIACCLYKVEPRKLSCFKVSIFSKGVCTTLQNLGDGENRWRDLFFGCGCWQSVAFIGYAAECSKTLDESEVERSVVAVRATFVSVSFFNPNKSELRSWNRFFNVQCSS